MLVTGSSFQPLVGTTFYGALVAGAWTDVSTITIINRQACVIVGQQFSGNLICKTPIGKYVQNCSIYPQSSILRDAVYFTDKRCAQEQGCLVPFHQLCQTDFKFLSDNKMLINIALTYKIPDNRIS